MSNQAWALEKMIRHGLQVDFSRGTIDCLGYNQGWYWRGKKTFYEALQEAIDDITKGEG